MKQIYSYLSNKIKGVEKRFSIAIILFAVALIIGTFTYQSYGISWDEGYSQKIGMVSYNYLFHGDKSLDDFECRDYGVAFELPLIILEKILRLNDFASIYLMRHFVTHLFFLLSAFALFLLIEYLYKDKLLATLGFFFLVLNPLIYGHSFFNSKDVPSMSMHIFCYLLAAIAFNKNKTIWYVLLGIACGLLTNMRIMGILFIFSILFLFFIDFIVSRKNKAEAQKIVKFSLIFIFFVSFTLYISWPYLYLHPYLNMKIAFMNMARFRWQGTMLFWGKTIVSTHLRWDYAITWFLISNPIIYLATGFTGLGLILYNLISHPLDLFLNKLQRNNLLYLVGFTVPLISVIVLHSILYDAWRHLYFIYPSFILLGIYGLNKLFKTKAKISIVIILFASFGFTGYYMVSNYPFQHVYFNQFVSNDEPEKIRKTFDLDYWGTSYQRGTEYILQTDTSSLITVIYKPSQPASELFVFNPNDRKRFKVTNDIKEADYVLTNYRDHPQDFPYPKSRGYYSIKVMNNSILTVFKIK